MKLPCKVHLPKGAKNRSIRDIFILSLKIFFVKYIASHETVIQLTFINALLLKVGSDNFRKN